MGFFLDYLGAQISCKFGEKIGSPNLVEKWVDNYVTKLGEQFS